MDGTFYLGDKLIDGSLDFVKKVEATGKISFLYKQFIKNVGLLY